MQSTRDIASSLTRLDAWARELIVDPLSKQPLEMLEDAEYFLSAYGRRYPLVGGVPDLRLLNNQTTRDQKTWKHGQRQYEELSRRLRRADHEQDYLDEIEGVRPVYQEVPVEGDCLDVGGHQGRLRAFLSPGQRYITCDPFLNVFDAVENCPNLLKAYPFLLDPVNFVCCDAEFLPFRSCSFDTVHMRSVIDHFLNPELALAEAYRVLRLEGRLIVGLLVRGGQTGHMRMTDHMKETAKVVLPALGFKQLQDHHVWHPSYEELTHLLTESGFTVASVHWQKGSRGKVCYVACAKREYVERLS